MKKNNTNPLATLAMISLSWLHTTSMLPAQALEVVPGPLFSQDGMGVLIVNGNTAKDRWISKNPAGNGISLSKPGATGTYYFGFNWTILEAPGPIQGGLWFYQGDAERAGFGAAYDDQNLSSTSPDGTVDLMPAIPWEENQTVRVVVKIEFTEGADKVTVWANPIENQGEDNQAGVSTATFTREMSMNQIRFRTEGGSSWMDSLMISHDFESAATWDGDGDTLPDGWERRFGLNPNIDDSWDDTDGDGLANWEEYTFGLNPTNPDTDGDGLSDKYELDNGLDPLNPDTDRDGLSDGDELSRGTDPLNPDSDGDGVADGHEVLKGTNPLDANDYPDGGNLALIGADDFSSYEEGLIDGTIGGEGFDYDNMKGMDSPFVGHTGTAAPWRVADGGGAPERNENGKLQVSGPGVAVRSFNGPSLGLGGGLYSPPYTDEYRGVNAINAEFQHHHVYLRADITRSGNVGESTLVQYDFENQRSRIGVLLNPNTGNHEFGLRNPRGETTYTGIQPEDGKSYTIVAHLDYNAGTLKMWVNPDLTGPEPAPTTSRSLNDLAWFTGVGLRSDGSGTVEWDHVVAAYSWEQLGMFPGYSTPVTLPLSADLLGADNFSSYSPGPLNGAAGGIGFDYDNMQGADDAYTGHTGTNSAWIVPGNGGTPSVTAGGRLRMAGSGIAYRPFNGPLLGILPDSPPFTDERKGVVAINGEYVHHFVYMRADVAWDGEVGEAALAQYDFGAQRSRAGVLRNPMSGKYEFGIEVAGKGSTYSGIEPEPGKEYTLVLRIDYSGNSIKLWVNPALDQIESAATVAQKFGILNWTTALGLQAANSGATEWGNVVAAYSWEQLGLFPGHSPFLINPGNLGLIGADDFSDYPAGSIQKADGGFGFDYDNRNKNDDAFYGHTGTTAYWRIASGSPEVTDDGRLKIYGQGAALRAFNGPSLGVAPDNPPLTDERKGVVAINGEYVHHHVYMRADVSWEGQIGEAVLAQYDFNNARARGGVMYNYDSERYEFALRVSNGDLVFSGIEPQLGRSYTIVLLIDIGRDQIKLWVNPDLTGPEPAPDASRALGDLAWATAIGVQASGDGTSYWDNVVAAYDWNQIGVFPGNSDSGIVPGTYAAWIQSQLPEAGAARGFGDDPDHDGIPNGIEHVLGTSPSTSSTGLGQTSANGSQFVFRHTRTNDAATDVTSWYEWSTDLASWHKSGIDNGMGVTVTLTDSVIEDRDSPDNDVIEVTATVTEGASQRLFVRLVAALEE